jgi:hypothetical protein
LRKAGVFEVGDRVVVTRKSLSNIEADAPLPSVLSKAIKLHEAGAIGVVSFANPGRAPVVYFDDCVLIVSDGRWVEHLPVVSQTPQARLNMLADELKASLAGGATPSVRLVATVIGAIRDANEFLPEPEDADAV